jgi:hypothetical protein
VWLTMPMTTIVFQSQVRGRRGFELFGRHLITGGKGERDLDEEDYEY